MAHRILKSVPKHPLQYPKGTINDDFAFSSCQLMLTPVFILKPHIPYMTPEQSYKTDQRHTYLSTFLRELRRNSGYTQEQVANLISLSRYSISRIENNGFYRIQHLYLLADFYQIPMSQLFSDVEES